jgi:thymidylate synthase
MKQYIDLVNRILKEGGASDDRTGTGTIKIFGHQSTYNMDDGFPLLTIKNTWMKGVTHELLWLLGNHKKFEQYENLDITNIKYLVDNNVHIWDEWADESGDLGPVYGKQWVDWGGYYSDGHWNSKTNSIGRYWDGINQIQIVIDKLTKGHKNFNPMDRGLVVSAWNVGELDDMALRPCHAFFQFQARELSYEEREKMFWNKVEVSTMEVKTHESFDGIVPRYELSLQLYQRSADTFLGVPFNIASYSLLLHMVCHVTGMKPGKFVHTFGDAHLYKNHKDQVNELLDRTYSGGAGGVDFWSNKNAAFMPDTYGPELPTLWLNPEVKNIFDFQYDDIKVLNYKPLGTIKAEVAV